MDDFEAQRQNHDVIETQRHEKLHGSPLVER